MRPSSTEQPQGADARPGKAMAGLGKLYKAYIYVTSVHVHLYIYIYICICDII